jgi:hypothetical protein
MKMLEVLLARSYNDSSTMLFSSGRRFGWQMDWVKYDEWRTEQAIRERREYDSLPVSVLLDDIRNGRYGEFYEIWYSLRERANLEEAGLVLLDVLESDAPFLVRSHCAHALVALAELDRQGWTAAQLTGEKMYPVKDNLKKVRQIVEDKLELGNLSA